MTNPEISRKALDALKGRWGAAIGTFFLYMILNGMVGFIPLAQLLIGGAFNFGLARYALHIARGQHAELDEIFSGFSHFGNTLATYLLMILRILLWSLLLVIPGIIAALGYSMTFYLLADDPSQTPQEVLQKSKDMMDGHKERLFYLCLRFLLLSMACIFTLGIGFLWLIPYIHITMATFYDDLKGTEARTGDTLDMV